MALTQANFTAYESDLFKFLLFDTNLPLLVLLY
jgi:hypothetical protein